MDIKNMWTVKQQYSSIVHKYWEAVSPDQKLHAILGAQEALCRSKAAVLFARINFPSGNTRRRIDLQAPLALFDHKFSFCRLETACHVSRVNTGQYHTQRPPHQSQIRQVETGAGGRQPLPRKDPGLEYQRLARRHSLCLPLQAHD